jgi:hypothetical protein
MSEKVKPARVLAEIIEDEEVRREVEDIKRINPLDALKADLFSFFKSMFALIKAEDDLENIIRAKIMQKIKNDELNTDQLTSLMKTIKNNKNSTLDVILSFFKPSPTGNVSPLLEDKSGQGDANSLLQLMNTMDPEEKEKLNKLTKALTLIGETPIVKPGQES